MIKQRKREYTGPSPHAVAIRARNPSKMLPEHLILERRRKDDQIEAAVKLTEGNLESELKMKWENMTDKKIKNNQINRAVAMKLKERTIGIEERRQKLRVMLADEDTFYISQAYSLKETMEEKHARMRIKAMQLKEKREAERQAIVSQKLDQQWQNQCEELRSVLSRRHQDQVCNERQHQLNMLAEIERERQSEEAMYAELWERDRLAKAAREEQERSAAMKRNYDMLDVLQSQRRRNEIKKLGQIEEINKEKNMLIEDRIELAQELQKIKVNDQTQRLKYRKQLRKQMETSKIAQTRDKQEELALETKILQNVVLEAEAEAKSEAMMKAQRKVEEASYHEYLKEQRNIDSERERKIEIAIQKDVELMDSKKAGERKKKKEARASYLQEVLTCRKTQIQERQKERQEERDETQRERIRINKIIDEFASHQQAQKEYTRNKNRSYARDVLCQAAHSDKLKVKRKDLDQKEYEEGLKTEQAYESRLREVLERPYIQKSHPLRMNALNKGSNVVFMDG